jgi:hypothetical protein
MKSITGFFLSLCAIALFSACTSNEIGESKDVSQDKIYQSYSISQYGETNDVDITCQFRFAGKNGTTLVLNTPSKIAFDNEVLKVDSSAASGAYYTTTKPAADFLGTHHFEFTDINNKKWENNFAFENFSLVNTPATASKTATLIIPFDAGKLSSGDHLELYTNNNDSSFSLEYTVGTDTGNAFIIPVKELKRQKANELILEAKIYKAIALQQASTEGGMISVMQKAKAIRIKLNN